MNNHSKKTGMKQCVIMLIGLMVSTTVHAEEQEYRTFTDTQGRTFEARLMDYETASESVVVTRPDGGKSRMALDNFSEADRLFIADWAVSHRLHEGLELIPTLRTASVSKKVSGVRDYSKKVFDVFYEIRFINRTDAPLERLEFEYCIFYNQGERKQRRAIHYEEGSCYGKGFVERLEPASEHMSETQSVRLFTEGGGVTLFGASVVSLANVRGIWIRLKTKLPSGGVSMREYRTSEDELWKWAPCSFGAGLNEGASEQTFFYTK